MSVHKKIQPKFGPAVWPAIGNIYIGECLVLLYRFDGCNFHAGSHAVYII